MVCGVTAAAKRLGWHAILFFYRTSIRMLEKMQKKVNRKESESRRERRRERERWSRKEMKRVWWVGGAMARPRVNIDSVATVQKNRKKNNKNNSLTGRLLPSRKTWKTSRKQTNKTRFGRVKSIPPPSQFQCGVKVNQFPSSRYVIASVCESVGFVRFLVMQRSYITWKWYESLEIVYYAFYYHGKWFIEHFWPKERSRKQVL